MARSHLTLAALATAAVADLDVAATSRFGAPGGDYDAALLTARDGKHLIIRAPRSQRAEADQSADLVAIRALSTGVRTRLPFAVSTFVGQVPIGGTRAIVYDFIYGAKVPLGSIQAGPDGLAASIGTAIAAIHSLPTSFITDAGLPSLGAHECLRAAVSVMDRASATGLVPATLQARWEKATEEIKLWQFQPTVVNNSLTAGSFLSVSDAVTGVLGWQELRVGDPAMDLFWLLGARDGAVAETAFDAYTAARGSADSQLKQRAMLYAELEIAKWLLHGTETRSTEIVDDAVGMLSGLVDSVQSDVMNPLGPQTMPTLAVDEVEAMLDRNEKVL